MMNNPVVDLNAIQGDTYYVIFLVEVMTNPSVSELLLLLKPSHMVHLYDMVQIFLWFENFQTSLIFIFLCL